MVEPTIHLRYTWLLWSCQHAEVTTTARARQSVCSHKRRWKKTAGPHRNAPTDEFNQRLLESKVYESRRRDCDWRLDVDCSKMAALRGGGCGGKELRCGCAWRNASKVRHLNYFEGDLHRDTCWLVKVYCFSCEVQRRPQTLRKLCQTRKKLQRKKKEAANTSILIERKKNAIWCFWKRFSVPIVAGDRDVTGTGTTLAIYWTEFQFLRSQK